MTSWIVENLPPFGLFWRYGGIIRVAAAGLAMAGGSLLLFSPISGFFLLGMAAATLYFFRCPRRVTPSSAGIVSPADGRVDVLDQVEDCPGIGGPATRIGIFLSVLDVHVTRSPLSGWIRQKTAVAGRFRNALSKDAGSANQRNEILLDTGDGLRVYLRQISGAIARRVIFEPEPGDYVQAGAIAGMIRFGSRVELYIPLECRCSLHVHRGSRVKAGITPLAHWTQGMPVSSSVLPVSEEVGNCKNCNISIH